MSRPDIRRMWINQPSSQQPCHQFHGMLVLAVITGDSMVEVYPILGNTISMVIPVLSLSSGWPIRTCQRLWGAKWQEST